MIGQRSLGARTPSHNQTTGASPAHRWLRLPGSPAVAGRQHLAHILGSSVLVQVMLSMTCLAVAALLYLAQAGQADVLQLTIAELQQQRSQLNAQNASLHATATQLQSLQRIDSEATVKLHMTKPDLSQTLWVTTDVPTVQPMRPLDATVRTAQQASQPAAQIQRFISFVISSL